MHGAEREVEALRLLHRQTRRMAALGVPIRTVMEMMEHSQVAMTAEDYTHVAPEMIRETGERMEAFVRDVEPFE